MIEKFIGPRQTRPLTDGYQLIFHRYSCLYVAFLYLPGFNHRCGSKVLGDVWDGVLVWFFRWLAKRCANTQGALPGASEVSGGASSGLSGLLTRSVTLGDGALGHSPSLLLCQPEASTPLSVNIFLKALTGVLYLNVDHGCSGFLVLFCFVLKKCVKFFMASSASSCPYR